MIPSQRDGCVSEIGVGSGVPTGRNHGGEKGESKVRCPYGTMIHML